MSYDNKIVRCPGDIFEPKFEGNNCFVAQLFASQPSIFNVIGGASFYLNSLQVMCNSNLTVAALSAAFTVYAGPNPGNIVGASTLFILGPGAPSAAPSPNPLSNNVVLMDIQNIGYRNRTGAPQYLHLVMNTAPSAGQLDFNITGGITSLLS